MSKTLLFVCYILMLNIYVNSVVAQQLAHKWLRHAGGKNIGSASDMAIDALNNLYVAGTFSDTVWFGPTRLAAQGSSDIFIAKYDKTGQLLWAKSLGGKQPDEAHSLAIDSQNNLYLCGKFQGATILGKQQLKSKSFADNFVACFDQQGELQWVNSFEGNTRGEKTLLGVDLNNNIFYAGTFFKQMKLGSKTLQTESATDIFISELDTEGKVLDAYCIGGRGYAKLQSFVCDTDNNLFISGSFTGDMNFESQTLEATGKEDIFIARLNNKKTIWAKHAGGYYTDLAASLVLNNGQLLLSGSFSDEAQFDNTSLLSEGVLDAFVAAYNLDGQLQWARQFGGQANEYVNSLLANADGSLYISGSYRGKIQAIRKEVESEQFSKDIYLAKFDKDGYFQWAESLGGNSPDFALKLVKDPEGYIYQAGNFAQNFKMGKEKALTKGLNNNFFIRKFYDCGLSSKIKLGDNCTLCQGTQLEVKGDYVSYLWNTGETKASIAIKQGGIYSVLATDNYGCRTADTVKIEMEEVPRLDLGTDIATGTLEPIELSTEGEYFSYLWSDGSTGKKLSMAPSLTDKTTMVSLTVSNSTGCTTTDSILVEQIAELNVNKDLNNNGYSVYPNPSNGKFTIICNHPGLVERVEIYDVKGNKVKNVKNISVWPLEVDLSNSSKGVYIIKLDEVNVAQELRVILK